VSVETFCQDSACQAVCLEAVLHCCPSRSHQDALCRLPLSYVVLSTQVARRSVEADTREAAAATPRSLSGDQPATRGAPPTALASLPGGRCGP